MRKLITKLLLTGVVLGGAGNLLAEGQIAGPRGGKLLENHPPRAEFLVDEKHNISINFYDENLKVVPVKDQIVTAQVDSKEGKQSLVFIKKGEGLVADKPRPQGDGYNIVVQVKQDQKSKAENFRVKYDAHVCGGCNHQEYACTCDE